MTNQLILVQNNTKKEERLTVDDLSRQKELEADPKAMHQIEFVGQLKITDDENADGTQSLFVLTILEKIRETTLKFSQGNATVR